MSLRRPTVARTVFLFLLWALYVVSPRRPTVALLFLHFPLKESFRHSFGTSIIISAFSARGVIQTLVWHPVFHFGIFLSICVHHGFSYIFVTDVWSSIKSGVCWYIIPVFLMFASTFKHTHWLVPVYCLGQIFAHGDKHRGDSLGTYVLTIAASRR